MFSLREIEDDQFIYRCHKCGWESESMTKEQQSVVPVRTSANHKPRFLPSVSRTRRSRFDGARPLGHSSGYRFEVWRLDPERCERIVQGARDVQKRT